MRLKRKKSVLPALGLALLLTSCVQAPPGASGGTGPAGETTEPIQVTAPTAPPQEGSSMADSLFSVNYNASRSMNPLEGTNIYNDKLFGLLYEGLFALSPTLEAENVLCESFTVTDGVLYHLELKSGVLFHDGTPLTAADVAATLQAAMRSSKYGQRLSDIESVTASGDAAVDIRLKRANAFLPALLDIPILKSGELDAEHSVGTGPYRYDGDRLSAFTSHRDYTPESLRTVYLREVTDDALAEAFSERVIDLLDYDPNAPGSLNIHMVHERRYYDTTQLVYLGFNTASGVGSDRLARQALSRLVDRTAVAREIYGGAARPSPFILSPALGLYEERDTAGYGFSREEFYRLAVPAGLEDVDEDGYLEYNGSALTLTILVNSDSPVREEAAGRIAADMAGVGVRTQVTSLPYDKYITALESGKFDLYLGEVKLRADLDLTALFSGALNYSKLTDSQYRLLMDAYLASSPEERREAALELGGFVAEEAALVPILYKQRAVLTHMGVVAGAQPSQSGDFRGILTWRFDLSR